MASGFGYDGGRSRCFRLWLEFAKCFSNADYPKQCTSQADNYLECLHHTKERARAQTLKKHLVQKLQREGKEGRNIADAPPERVIASVGLIGGDKQ